MHFFFFYIIKLNNFFFFILFTFKCFCTCYFSNANCIIYAIKLLGCHNKHVWEKSSWRFANFCKFQWIESSHTMFHVQLNLHFRPSRTRGNISKVSAQPCFSHYSVIKRPRFSLRITQKKHLHWNIAHIKLTRQV